MFKSRYRLCELLGIPVYIDISLVFLLFLFATGGGSLFDGLFCAALLLASITAHEFGHALMARRFGCETSDITLSLLGGCASLIAMPRKAREEFLTAIAGPAVSFALSLAGVGLVAAVATVGGFGDAFGYVWTGVLRSFGLQIGFSGELAVSHGALWFVDMAAYLAVMNGVLGLFNLLPGFPLDGGRVFRSLVRSVLSRERATYIAMIVGRVVAVGIGLSGLVRLANGRNWGFVSIMIAWMIWREGYLEYQRTRMESDFRHWTQSDFNARVSPPPYDR